jgi:hypothetical protein
MKMLHWEAGTESVQQALLMEGCTHKVKSTCKQTWTAAREGGVCIRPRNGRSRTEVVPFPFSAHSEANATGRANGNGTRTNSEHRFRAGRQSRHNYSSMQRVETGQKAIHAPCSDVMRRILFFSIFFFFEEAVHLARH